MISKIENIEDNHLVIKIKDDNKEAFNLLYYRYCKKLYYFSLKYLHNSEEAEELVQSVFTSVWIHRKSLDVTLSVKNYIYRSAVNYIYNHLKKKAIRTQFIESELQKGEFQSNQTYDQVFFNDLEESINSIIKTLPSQQQQVFRLSRIESLTHEEIAQKLDISLRTVENHIYRALKIIKNKLKDKF